MSLEHTESTIQHNMDLNTLKPEHIDYIIFLDSDDYWKLNCIETCIKHAEGVDIVWFDFLAFYEDDPKKKWGKTMQECFFFPSNMCISSEEWLAICVRQNITSFWFAWQGLIHFSFLTDKGIYFLNGVIHEDHDFGVLLFLQSKNIYIIKEKMLFYRIRQNSITNADENTQLPPCVQHIYHAFNNYNEAKMYHKKTSIFFMFVKLLKFLDSNKSKQNEIARAIFLPFYASYSQSLVDSKNDPLHIIPQMLLLEPYMESKFRYKHKLRIANPKKYKQMLPLFRIYDGIKVIERKIRKAIRAPMQKGK